LVILIFSLILAPLFSSLLNVYFFLISSAFDGGQEETVQQKTFANKFFGTFELNTDSMNLQNSCSKERR